MQIEIPILDADTKKNGGKSAVLTKDCCFNKTYFYF